MVWWAKGFFSDCAVAAGMSARLTLWSDRSGSSGFKNVGSLLFLGPRPTGGEWASFSVYVLGTLDLTGAVLRV